MLDKIRFHCHQILPAIYDESMSYYELLCKVVYSLNEVIDSTNLLTNNFEEEIVRVVNEFFKNNPDYTIPDKSITESKINDEFLKRIVNVTVSPTEFGANPNGSEYSDTAIQNAINTGLPVKFESGNYIIGHSIVIIGAKTVSGRGRIVDFNGSTITIQDNDEPCVVVRGAGSILKNGSFTATYLQNQTYTSSLILQISERTDVNIPDNAQNNTFENIIVRCYNISDEVAQNSSGFGIKVGAVGDGTQGGYNYFSTYKHCTAVRLGSALKIVKDAQHSRGVNACTFEIDSWHCLRYVDGSTDGCHYRGTCQCTEIVNSGGLELNKYALNIKDEIKTTEFNNFDVMFYDYYSPSIPTRQKVVNIDESIRWNTFPITMTGSGVDGEVFNNNIILSGGSNRNFILPSSNIIRKGVNAINIMPHQNSFNIATNWESSVTPNASQPLTCELLTVDITGANSNLNNKYATATSDNGYMPHDFAALCWNNSIDRGLYFTSGENGTMIFDFRAHQTVRLANIFIYFGSLGNLIKSATLDFVDDDKNIFASKTMNVIGSAETLVCWNSESDPTVLQCKRFKVTIVFKSITSYKSLSSISGTMFNARHGLICGGN